MNYSWGNEEKFVLEFFGGRRDGFFVDIGAHDGILLSNVRALWERNWSGIFVEADPLNFGRLKANYDRQPRATLIHAAVMDNPLAMTTRFLSCPQGQGTWSTLCQLFSEKIMRENQGASYATIVVPATSLDAVVGDRKVDFLTIDTEGFDGRIVKSIDFTKLRPKLLMYEEAHLMPLELPDPYLNQAGYTKVFSESGTVAWSD